MPGRRGMKSPLRRSLRRSLQTLNAPFQRSLQTALGWAVRPCFPKMSLSIQSSSCFRAGALVEAKRPLGAHKGPPLVGNILSTWQLATDPVMLAISPWSPTPSMDGYSGLFLWSPGASGASLVAPLRHFCCATFKTGCVGATRNAHTCRDDAALVVQRWVMQSW